VSTRRAGSVPAAVNRAEQIAFGHRLKLLQPCLAGTAGQERHG
jgi:hypothetical protein